MTKINKTLSAVCSEAEQQGPTIRKESQALLNTSKASIREIFDASQQARKQIAALSESNRQYTDFANKIPGIEVKSDHVSKVAKQLSEVNTSEGPAALNQAVENKEAQRHAASSEVSLTEELQNLTSSTKQSP